MRKFIVGIIATIFSWCIYNYMMVPAWGFPFMGIKPILWVEAVTLGMAFLFGGIAALMKDD